MDIDDRYASIYYDFRYIHAGPEVRNQSLRCIQIGSLQGLYQGVLLYDCNCGFLAIATVKKTKINERLTILRMFTN